MWEVFCRKNGTGRFPFGIGVMEKYPFRICHQSEEETHKETEPKTEERRNNAVEKVFHPGRAEKSWLLQKNRMFDCFHNSRLFQRSQKMQSIRSLGVPSWGLRVTGW
jgi:hypothetical protein